jgi:hypothetical protein
VKKLALVVAFCGSLACSPVHAKTFIGVLWPMFGPLPAIGLVELVAELKMMPDVEIETYVHQAWPSLVEDIARQPAGTHTVVIGYSLGANSSVSVANNAKYVDLIIALQPSMLSWNPDLTGKVGRMIEIYNPNPWLTWGGMGSKKLVGDNIEYITNNDSHPGAQFNSEFRTLAKTEIAKFGAQDRLDKERVETAQATTPGPIAQASVDRSVILDFAEEPATRAQKDAAAKVRRQIAQSETPKETPKQTPNSPKPAAPGHLAKEQARPAPNEPTEQKPAESAAFVDTLLSSVDAGDLSATPELTRAAMLDHAKRTYGVAAIPDAVDSHRPVGGEVIAVSDK